ncbi:uncharacterized protein LOC133871780 [Alnus glutinosa]|uniref:uncharacterized protein LOC133871780 n=1 Tax=Alnus glutinosa TaxID=3517 RepID=UPI002D77875B|nr:uncharacterized protein LOC133871780 [Alnus glutinosa]
MEELHMAAAAYYNNSSWQLQQLAGNFFGSMDMNGDGRVSFHEFVAFFRWDNPNNGDGSLDFYEVLTLYYIMKTRGVWCKNCKACLLGLYFTCVQFFDTASDPYDLCGACYTAWSFHHPHASFLDNYVLLRSKRGLPPGVANPNLVIKPMLAAFLLV